MLTDVDNEAVETINAKNLHYFVADWGVSRTLAQLVRIKVISKQEHPEGITNLRDYYKQNMLQKMFMRNLLFRLYYSCGYAYLLLSRKQLRKLRPKKKMVMAQLSSYPLKS